MSFTVNEMLNINVELPAFKTEYKDAEEEKAKVMKQCCFLLSDSESNFTLYVRDPDEMDELSRNLKEWWLDQCR